MKKIEKKIILITGASGGLGVALSLLLASEKSHIIGVSKNLGGLEDLKHYLTKASKGSFELIAIDLKNNGSVKDFAEEIFQRWGGLDIIIHCAAISTGFSPVSSIFEKDFQQVFMNNVLSTKILISHTDKLLKNKPGGKAIFIDDPMSGKFVSTYAASKAATKALILSYQRESIRLGPSVHLFSPRPMPTKLRHTFFPGEDKNKLSSCLSQAKELIKIIQEE